MLRLTINSDQLIRGIADHEKAAALKDLADLKRHTSPPQPPEARSLTIEATHPGMSCAVGSVADFLESLANKFLGPPQHLVL